MLFSFMFSLTFLVSKHYNKYKEIPSFETFLQFRKQLSFETNKNYWSKEKLSFNSSVLIFKPKILSLLFVNLLLSLSFLCKPKKKVLSLKLQALHAAFLVWLHASSSSTGTIKQEPFEEIDEFHKEDHTNLWFKHKIRVGKDARKRKKMRENEEKTERELEKLWEENWIVIHSMKNNMIHTSTI